MIIADWAFFGYLLLLVVPLAWLEIRYMARSDRHPEEEVKWPEWWVRDAIECHEESKPLRWAA